MPHQKMDRYQIYFGGMDRYLIFIIPINTSAHSISLTNLWESMILPQFTLHFENFNGRFYYKKMVFEGSMRRKDFKNHTNTNQRLLRQTINFPLSHQIAGFKQNGDNSHHNLVINVLFFCRCRWQTIKILMRNMFLFSLWFVYMQKLMTSKQKCPQATMK